MQALLKFVARHAPLLAALGAFLVFAPTLGHGFLAWDDRVHTVENAHLLDTAYFWKNANQGMYMPLTFSMWSLVARWFGDDATMYHALNVLLHAANAALCWKLLSLLLRLDARTRELPAPRISLAALLGALLFAWHPLQVEPVSWITSLKDVGCGTFALAALVLHLSPADSPERALRLRVLAVAALAAATLFKPAAASVILMMLAIDVLWRGKTAQDALRGSVPFVLAAVPSLALNASSQSTLTLLYPPPLAYRPLIALDAIGFYAKKLIAPWEILPAYERAPRLLIESGRIWYTWLLGGAVVALVVATRRVLPHLAQCATLTLAGVALTLGLMPFAAQDNSTVYDRYLYLSMLGPAWGLACLALRGVGSRRVVLALLVLLAGKSVVQSRAWKSDESLWSFTLQRRGASTVALVNLASIRSKQGRTAEAMSMLDHALYVKPWDPQAHNNLGALFAEQGRLQEAGRHFAAAVQLDPHNAGALANFAQFQLKSGDLGGAERTLRHLLEIAPAHRDGNLTLGEILVNTGRAGECRALLQRFLNDLDRDPEALTLLGVAEAQTGALDAAIMHFQSALALDPSYAMARQNLETALTQARAKESGRP